MATTTEFRDKLNVACAMELSGAKSDLDRLAAAIEALSAALGFAIAIAAQGDARAVNAFLEGSIAYVTEEVARRAPFAEFMNRAVKAAKG